MLTFGAFVFLSLPIVGGFLMGCVVGLFDRAPTVHTAETEQA